MFFAEKGFPPPKKCKKCKDFQKNKKVYKYTPSQKELELKEKMDKKMEVVKAIKTNRFAPIELNDSIMGVVKESKTNWADIVEEEEKKQQNTKKSWASIV